MNFRYKLCFISNGNAKWEQNPYIVFVGDESPCFVSEVRFKQKIRSPTLNYSYPRFHSSAPPEQSQASSSKTLAAT